MKPIVNSLDLVSAEEESGVTSPAFLHQPIHVQLDTFALSLIRRLDHRANMVDMKPYPEVISILAAGGKVTLGLLIAETDSSFFLVSPSSLVAETTKVEAEPLTQAPVARVSKATCHMVTLSDLASRYYFLKCLSERLHDFDGIIAPEGQTSIRNHVRLLESVGFTTDLQKAAANAEDGDPLASEGMSKVVEKVREAFALANGTDKVVEEEDPADGLMMQGLPSSQKTMKH